jgi:DNA modification methylase
MTVHHADHWLTIHGGDCREVLRTLEPESVHCVITSPPYWGLRDYGTATWDGGDPDCDHQAPKGSETSTLEGGKATQESAKFYRDICRKCGARRIDAQLGLEATPEEYVATMVDVFREVRRVLRSDGTVWLNLGDSFVSTSGALNITMNSGNLRDGRGSPRSGATTARRAGLAAKQLVGIPWRTAFALQADGWYLRSDIIWAKPNPMPESVTDRPTKAHEYVFLLSKAARYFYDADAVREANLPASIERAKGGYVGTEYRNANSVEAHHGKGFMRSAPGEAATLNPAGRNLRSVWTIATAPYPGAHFATFPPKLVEPCVKAGTSERGVCPDCGAPWARVVEREGGERYATGKSATKNGAGLATAFSGYTDGSSAPTFTTTGWRPTCDHGGEPVPAVVLDPFAGTGTVGMVAQSLSRRAVLIDLNPDYLAQCLGRNRQMPLGVGS